MIALTNRRRFIRSPQAAQNPIEWQELNHQTRSAPRFFKRWGRVGPLLLILIVAGISLTLLDFTAPTREIAVYAVWLFHALAAVRAILAGANVISREHVGQTWDALVLTGVSARWILLGKWLAAMRRVAFWMAALGTVRLAMIPIWFMALTNRYAWRVAVSGYYGPGGYYDDLPIISWMPAVLFLAVSMTLLLTVLEMCACTALGMAASAATRRGMYAVIAAMSIRFAPVALFAAFTRYDVGANARPWRVLGNPLLALADSGTAPLSQLSVPVISWTYNRYGLVLPGLFVAAAILVVIFALSLTVAWMAIRLSGALPHEQTESQASSTRGFRRWLRVMPAGD